jgi:multidrug efflux pump
MSLSEICIKRPVFAWVLTLVIIVVGAVAFTKMPLQQLPSIKEPAVTIEANYQGVGPEIMEAQITRLIEEHMGGIEGLDFMQSSSKDGKSEVTLVFYPSTDLDSATSEVRDRLARVHQSGSWPHEVLPPTLRKTRNDDRPIMQLALVSENVSLDALFDYAENDIKKRFEAVPGVGNVEITGSGLYVMRVYIDPTKLAAYAITTDQVLEAIRKQNFERPIGKLKSFDREYLVTAVSNLEKAEEFDQIIIISTKDSLLRIKDIGYSKLETNNRDSKTTLNGKPGIRIAVFKQALANPIEISRGVRKELASLQEQLPKDRSMFISGDQSEFIERSIKEVYRTILESVLLVIFVVFFFLRSFRASLIPLVTIPVSLIGTFAVMQMLGFSINTLTLMAIVLAIGLVVDDAIVVLENIYRYIEEGMEPFKAAVVGIKEISKPVIAMTITLAAVYAPVSFASGRVGKFLGEFALTLSVSVIISGFAALTLSPMMCARLLQPHTDQKDYTQSKIMILLDRYFPTEEWLKQIDILYNGALQVALKKRFYVILSGIALALFGYFEWTFLPKIQEPKQDTGFIYIKGHAPFTSTLSYTDKYVKQLDDYISTIPEVERRSSSIINAVSFDMFINLYNDRSRSADEIKTEIEQQRSVNSGIYIERVLTSASSNSADAMIEIALRTNKDLKTLKSLSAQVSQALRGKSFVGGAIQGSTMDSRFDYSIKINREKALALKIDPRAIAETIETLIRGKKANTFKRNNRVYDVMVEVEEQDKRKKEDILKLLIRTGGGQGVKEGTLLPLAELISIDTTIGLPDILRYNRQRATYLYIPLQHGADMQSAIDEIKIVLSETLDEDSSYEWVGSTRTFLNEKSIMSFIFGLSLIFIYLVLSAQFESWRDPLIIMLSVPLSLAGAILTLVLIKDGSINMYSNIGLITLVGLITKHGILIVQFANELQEKGLSITEATLQACSIRLRPILMTTAAMVLGAVPLALATGPGCEIRRQIGWVIVGGMSIGTIFTLFVLPAIYSYLGIYKPKKTG